MKRARKLDQDGALHFALSLPGAQQGVHVGRPDLRVANKIFATLPEGGKCVNIKSTSPNVDALVHTDPQAYHDCWAGTWVSVDLSRVDGQQVRELLVDAWKLAAPPRLLAETREEVEPVAAPKSIAKKSRSKSRRRRRAATK